MRIVDIRERTVPISRYADPAVPSGGLTTSIVALISDTKRNGEPVVGYGFSSVGRFAQGGLIEERFAPRLLAAEDDELAGSDGQPIDPFKAWTVMMAGEKPGGHGERCVAVGTLDMAVWDLAAKLADKPLYRYLGETLGRPVSDAPIPAYAGGGYLFPDDDIGRLKDEARYFVDLGFTAVKIKIGALPIDQDLKRIEAVLSILSDGNCLAVDAMNSYKDEQALTAAAALAPYRLRWFEDICDPLDYRTHAAVADAYDPPLSAGEALFSAADATNLLRYGGLRSGHDVLTFDPVHCYGLPEYIRIVDLFEAAGWSRRDFQPHGGHLFGLHVAAGLGLGGAECNPHNFQPFGGFGSGQRVVDGAIVPPDAPGIGFQTRATLINLFRTLTVG